MNSREPTALLSGGQQKITSWHLQRLAIVYVRQSTTRQVQHNQESQVNQYQLAQHAEALGWNRDRVRVIDTDLGLSGRSSEHRSGFKELAAEVSLGHVGIVFGYEVSRLARNNKDWYYLLDLAALFGTLIGDSDGLYDPRLFNDRLLLGLKGTMSEAELHLLRLRLDAGRLRKVERGEWAQTLPTGLIRLADGTVVKDPDDQVRHAIEFVLAKFAELGSARQVLRYLHAQQVLLPRRQTVGPALGQLLWKKPSHAAILEIIRNPAYAGAFAYGRTQVDPVRRQAAGAKGGVVRKPMEEWGHLQQDVYPAYISWEQYLANQERLRQNATRFQERLPDRPRGAAREGPALLQGLVRCAQCGRRMEVVYNPAPRYVCAALKRDFAEPPCASLDGPAIDAVVVQAFFAAIAPAQLDALAAVLEAQRTERQQLLQQWEERRKRAHYEAALAQRQYNAVDPENRLVTAELERRWEEKLRQLQATQEDYDRFLQTAPPPDLPADLRQQFQHLAESLPVLWNSGQLSNGQKKDLLRSLIAAVVLQKTAPGTVEVRIVWVSGHYSVVYAQTPIYRTRDLPRYAEMVERLHALWQQGQNDQQIAAQLTAAGFRSARSLQVTAATVQRIRLGCGWQDHPAPSSSQHHLEVIDGYVGTKQLGIRLGVNRSWVYRRIRNGQIDPKYVMRHPQTKAYLVRDDAEVIEQLRNQLAHKPCANGGI
jgi:DNA invertase Pin-like site-specific DNA recombinase